jgi:hypothetical protein
VGAACDKGKLAAGTLHLEDTGFPWEAEANVYTGVRIPQERGVGFRSPETPASSRFEPSTSGDPLPHSRRGLEG